MSSNSKSIAFKGQLPIVSIVTPTYNQAQFIRETMSSVFNQTYPSIEYIVCLLYTSDAADD